MKLIVPIIKHYWNYLASIKNIKNMKLQVPYFEILSFKYVNKLKLIKEAENER